MNIKNKIFLIAFAALVIMLSVFQTFAMSDEHGWYCMRMKNHERPNIAPEFKYLKDYNGIYIGNNEKTVYLTFDAGYENGNVAKILDTLKAEEVHGTFFLLSNVIERNTDLVLRMFNEGHTVANHTCKHQNMSQWSCEQIKTELECAEKICYEKTDCQMSKLFRPPEGKFSRQMLESLSSLGYKTVFWSFAYADWDNARQPDCEKAKQKILDNVHPGAVLLLHPTSDTNAKILGDVIKELKSQGYAFGRIEDIT